MSSSLGTPLPSHCPIFVDNSLRPQKKWVSFSSVLSVTTCQELEKGCSVWFECSIGCPFFPLSAFLFVSLQVIANKFQYGYLKKTEAREGSNLFWNIRKDRLHLAVQNGKNIIKVKWAWHKKVQAVQRSFLWLCPLVLSPGNGALLGALHILIDHLCGDLG